jgi:ketosteroid isomerase-like protein
MMAAEKQSTGATREIVDRYYAAWGNKDIPTVRSLLHDDLSFRGPIDTFNRADDYVASVQNLFAIVRGVEPQRVFVDGDDACTIYDLVTATPAGTAPVAEWITVRGDKIAAIRVYFDARPFAPPSGH